MKHLLLALILFNCVSLMSQVTRSPKHHYVIGAGAFFQGSGDYLLPKLSFEFRHEPWKRMGFGIGAKMGHLNYQNRRSFSTYNTIITTSAQIEPLMYLNLISGPISFRIGTGLSFLYITETTSAQIYQNTQGEIFEDLASETRYAIGGHIWPEIEIYLSERIAMIIQGGIRLYTNEDISSGASMGVVIR